MDKETLLKRKQEIETAMQQTMANYNVLQGGINEVNHWLSEIYKPEEEV